MAASMVDGCGASYTVKRRVEAAGRRDMCPGVNRLLFLCQLKAGYRGLTPISPISQARLAQVNEWLGEEVVSFKEFELTTGR
ncbi:hypothetical protein FHP26_01840 [Pseudomonas orientalis]|nr:hypothetical protein [Pseudomonas orientalis]